MKFNLNVAPLKAAMDLGIIQSNISKFFEKSTVIELSVEGDLLRLNTQATSLLSEATIKGYNEEKFTGSAIVDCTLFKQLINTIDSNEVTLDFQDNMLVVMSGKSKFNVPKLLEDEEGASLDRPELEENLKSSFSGELHPSMWKYIQDHQLYSVAMSQVYKVYTRVWVSKDKGVLAGDYSTSMFTYQPHSDLDSSCLVSPTIVNLLSVLEEGTKLYHMDEQNYVVCMNTDSFDFRSQFTVEHEDENGIGVYAADDIFSMVFDDSVPAAKISQKKLYSTVKQAALFASSSDPLVFLVADENGIVLENDNVSCKVNKDSYPIEYKVGFNISELDTVVSHMDGDELQVAPIVKDDEVYGVRFVSGDMVALIGSVEE